MKNLLILVLMLLSAYLAIELAQERMGLEEKNKVVLEVKSMEVE